MLGAPKAEARSRQLILGLNGSTLGILEVSSRLDLQAAVSAAFGQALRHVAAHDARRRRPS